MPNKNPCLRPQCRVWNVLAIHEEALHDGAPLGPANQQVRRHPAGGDDEARRSPGRVLVQTGGGRPRRGAHDHDQQRHLPDGHEHAVLVERGREQGDPEAGEGDPGSGAQVQPGGATGAAGEAGPVRVREEAEGADEPVRRPGGEDHEGARGEERE